MIRVCIIGPPAVGKTLLGSLVAARLGVKFTDTDELVRQHFGPPAEMLLRSESQFRNAESTCLRKALSRGGVISTGGGCVIRRDNQRLISQNLVIFLRASFEYVAPRLCSQPRPLTGDEESWKTVYSQRKKTYLELADIVFDANSSNASRVANALLKLIRGHYGF